MNFTVRNVCRVILLVLVALGFFSTIRADIEGRMEKKPVGFRGVIGTFISFSIVVLLYWGCDLFSFD